MKKTVLAVLLLAFLLSCTSGSSNAGNSAERGGKMKLTSAAFEHEGEIPADYTCEGEDKIPALEISEIPENAKSLALIMDDPDAPAGTWVHWVVFNIPPGTKNIEAQPEGTAGKNSWGRTNYGGPCPPSGVHRYFFKLYALDTLLELAEGAEKAELESAMQGHIIAEAVLMGKYQKKSN